MHWACAAALGPLLHWACAAAAALGVHCCSPWLAPFRRLGLRAWQQQTAHGIESRAARRRGAHGDAALSGNLAARLWLLLLAQLQAARCTRACMRTLQLPLGAACLPLGTRVARAQPAHREWRPQLVGLRAWQRASTGVRWSSRARSRRPELLGRATTHLGGPFTCTPRGRAMRGSGCFVQRAARSRTRLTHEVASCACSADNNLQVAR